MPTVAHTEPHASLLREFSEGFSPSKLKATGTLRDTVTAYLASQESVGDLTRTETYLHYTKRREQLHGDARHIIGYMLAIDALDRLSRESDLRRLRLWYGRETGIAKFLSEPPDALVDRAANLFNTLTDDPSENLERLLRSTEVLPAHAYSLTLTGVESATEERIATLVDTAEEQLDAEQTTILKSVLFSAAAVASFWYFPKPLEGALHVIDDATRLVIDPDIQQEARKHYAALRGVQVVKDQNPRLGTTSFLLVCADGETERAVKCVFPRYWQTRIGIATARAFCDNQAYERVLSGAVPAVAYSDSSGIRMNLIYGPTISEAIRDNLWSRRGRHVATRWRRVRALVRRISGPRDADEPPPGHVLDAIAVCIQKICTHLGRLAGCDPTSLVISDDCADKFDPASFKRCHLDLSPDNLILKDTPPPYSYDWDSVALIDFGINYSVGEGLGFGERFEHAIVFVAPELQRSAFEGNYLCDIYSLGLVALEMSSPEPLTLGSVPERLERLWRRSAFLARVVEDMVDRNQRNRLVGQPHRDDGAKSYEALGERIREAVDQDKHAATPPRYLPGAIKTLLLLLRPEPPRLRDARNWLYAYRIAWWTTLILGIAIISQHWHVARFILPSSALADYAAGNTHGHAMLWSQLVAVSTAFIAYTYYTYIFASLPVGRDAPTFARLAGWTARLGPLVAMFLQIAALLYPLPLAVPAGFGGILIALNNRLWLALTGRAQEVAKAAKLSTVGKHLDEFYAEFRPWWFLMGAYSAGGVAIGFLLDQGVAHDTGIYAIMLALGVNLVLLFFYKICRDAARTRAALTRALFLIQRDGRATEPEPARAGASVTAVPVTPPA